MHNADKMERKQGKWLVPSAWDNKTHFWKEENVDPRYFGSENPHKIDTM